MPAISVTKNWNDGDILTESMLDDIKNSVETFLNTTKLDLDNIQTGGVAETNIATGAVTTTKIDSLAVTAAKIAADAVTTVKILDANVTAAKLASDAVTTVKILDANITAAKMAANSIATTNIIAGAVTQAKRAALGNAAGQQSAGYTNTTTSDTAVSGLSGSVTTTGRPVMVVLASDAGFQSGASYIRLRTTNAGGLQTGAIITLYDADSATAMALWEFAYNAVNNNAPGAAWPVSVCVAVFTPSAGTFNFNIQGKCTTSQSELKIAGAKVYAWEL